MEHISLMDSDELVIQKKKKKTKRIMMHWLACIDILIKVLSGQLKGKKNRLMKIKLSMNSLNFD